MTYQDAIKTLPLGAVWSASFGNPGDGGYSEIYRANDERYQIKNGSYLDFAPFIWTVKRISK